MARRFSHIIISQNRFLNSKQLSKDKAAVFMNLGVIRLWPIKLKYGLSQEEYREMVIKQGGKCLICNKKKDLYVDHDHQSGIVRGLLCYNCNIGIGLFYENIDHLNNAIKYLCAEEK